jgi:membrane-associated protease RseP (regulator of RpoE activity)
MHAGWLPLLSFSFCLPASLGGCVEVSGWTIFFALLAAYIGVLAVVARRAEEDGSLKLAGPLILWRTKRGQRLLDRIASPRGFWRRWGDLGIGATVVAGALTLALLLFQLVLILQQPEQVSENAPEPVLLLGIPGVNPLIPIWYGIVALLVALVVHEGSHGIMSRVADLKVKSMGLLLFIVPIGAFVEPDEEDLKRASVRDRNRVYSAGPMSNLVVCIVAAAVFSGILMGSLSVVGAGSGVGVAGLVDGSPAAEAGIEAGDAILEVDGRPVNSSGSFAESLSAPLAAPGARGQGYVLDGHQDALRTPANRSLDDAIVGGVAVGAWVDPDGREPAPVVSLGRGGDARPGCAGVQLAVVPGDEGPSVRFDRGSSRHVATFPDQEWPSNWTRVGADATGQGVALMLGGEWTAPDETTTSPGTCSTQDEPLQAWVGAGPGTLLDGGVDEVRVLDDLGERSRLSGVLDEPYQGEEGPSRNASQPARLLGGEVLALQMDEDDVHDPWVGVSRDASPAERHAELVGPRAGEPIQVTFLSEGDTRTVTVTLTDKHAYYAEEAPDRNRESFRGAGFLGVSVVPLDRVEFFRSALAQPLDRGVGGVLFYISYPFLVFTQQLDLLNAPLNAFFTVSGPAAGLGGGFWVLANGLYWIFWINLMLGTFNALPAGPLDGGQMLRETLKDGLLGWYGVDDEDLAYEEDEEENVQVQGRDPATQRTVDRVDGLVSRTMWTVGLAILALILLPVLAPKIVPLIP